MTHILELVREQMSQQQVMPPTPTEKAQIVIVYNGQQSHTVVRFSSTKKAKKEHAKLKKAWVNCTEKVHHDIDGDMFVCTVHVMAIATICYVDHDKRAKFVPIA